MYGMHQLMEDSLHKGSVMQKVSMSWHPYDFSHKTGRVYGIWSHPSHYPVFPYTSPFKVMAKVKLDGHWGFQFNLYVYSILWQSNHFWLRYSKFQIWPWRYKIKVMAKVKFDGHIWGLGLNQYVCYLFHANWTIFGRDIVNFIFDLDNQGQGYGQDQIWWSYLKIRVQSICLLFVLWRPFLGEI